MNYSVVAVSKTMNGVIKSGRVANIITFRENVISCLSNIDGVVKKKNKKIINDFVLTVQGTIEYKNVLRSSLLKIVICNGQKKRMKN